MTGALLLRKTIGWAVLLLGRALAVVAYVATAVSFLWCWFKIDKDGFFRGAQNFVVPAGFVTFGNWTWNVAARMLRRLEHDVSRLPPVLVLRSFKEEDRNIHGAESGGVPDSVPHHH
ncbi:hypothetical protein Anae109_4007 [Anaeromyxobacter sp. Fw109-5]|nr:hypothetical protein Anae109_4007 [Anaeromyxobacter sp. Fw109-5]